MSKLWKILGACGAAAATIAIVTPLAITASADAYTTIAEGVADKDTSEATEKANTGYMVVTEKSKWVKGSDKDIFDQIIPTWANGYQEANGSFKIKNSSIIEKGKMYYYLRITVNTVSGTALPPEYDLRAVHTQRENTNDSDIDPQNFTTIDWVLQHTGSHIINLAGIEYDCW